MWRALRSNELGCPLIVSFRTIKVNGRLSTIPNAVQPRFESGKMPYATFDPSDNQAVLGRPLTNCNCRVGRKLHHNASIEGEKIVRRIVDARTIDVHWAHSNLIQLSGIHFGSFFSIADDAIDRYAQRLAD